MGVLGGKCEAFSGRGHIPPMGILVRTLPWIPPPLPRVPQSVISPIGCELFERSGPGCGSMARIVLRLGARDPRTPPPRAQDLRTAFRFGGLFFSFLQKSLPRRCPHQGPLSPGVLFGGGALFHGHVDCLVGFVPCVPPGVGEAERGAFVLAAHDTGLQPRRASCQDI